MYLINQEKLEFKEYILSDTLSKVTPILKEDSILFDSCILAADITASFELSCKKASFVNSIILGLKQKGKLEVNKITFTIFYKNRNTWKLIPIQKINIFDDHVEIIIPLLYISSIELNIQHSIRSRNVQLKLNYIQLKYSLFITVKSTTYFDHLGMPENLIDQRTNLGWVSKKHLSNVKDSLDFDLKSEYYLSSCVLTSSHSGEKVFFPKEFQILLSLDKQSWSIVSSQSNLYTNFSRDYEFSFSCIKARYVRIIISEHSKSITSFFQSQLGKVNFGCVPENLLLDTLNNELCLSSLYASELIVGGVRLAGDGEVTPNLAVQANDSRLRHGTTDYSGIVQLAKDGEFKSNKVIQSNDSRLQKGTVDYLGIIQFARNGEVQANKAVQSNDLRLNKSSTKSPGIVQFAKDGEAITNLAVQSNDSRLRFGTEQEKGIVQFAKDGESFSNLAVQSNDFRLQKASTELEGIIQLAKDGEEKKSLVVQSHDSRLKKASQTEYGRVLLAKNNEVASGKVVQSTDFRLALANEKQSGIFKVAPHLLTSSKHVLLSDDPRLNNAREALPHTHDYAEKNHLFSSHSGYLHLDYQLDSDISTKKESLYWKFSSKDFPMAVTNMTGPSALFYGSVVISSEKDCSLILRSKEGVAIEAYSANENAGKFMSRTDYALVLPNQIGNMSGSGRSLSVQGISKFADTIYLQNSCLYALDDFSFAEESFIEGDLVTIHSGKLSKVSSKDDSILGVLVSSALLVSKELLDEKSVFQQKSPFLLGVVGKVKVRVVGKGSSGDLIIYSDSFVGVGSVSSSFEERSASFGKQIILLEDKITNSDTLVWCMLV